MTPVGSRSGWPGEIKAIEYMLFYSDIELAVRKSKTLERRLRREFGAQGEGLGQLIKSVQKKLPDETIQHLNRVNKMRNDVVHIEEHNRLENRRQFVELCDGIERSLDKITKSKRAQDRDQWFLVIAFVTIVLIICILLQNPA
jgi:hypothetical protein